MRVISRWKVIMCLEMVVTTPRAKKTPILEWNTGTRQSTQPKYRSGWQSASVTCSICTFIQAGEQLINRGSVRIRVCSQASGPVLEPAPLWWPIHDLLAWPGTVCQGHIGASEGEKRVQLCWKRQTFPICPKLGQWRVSGPCWNRQCNLVADKLKTRSNWWGWGSASRRWTGSQYKRHFARWKQ